MDIEQLARDLEGPFDLSSDRKREAQIFDMNTNYIHFGMNGERLATESYLLRIQYIPEAENVDEYMCSEPQLQINGGPLVSIPELSNWTYIFNPTLSGADDRGPLWGIPQDKFANINDSEGRALPFSIRYGLYTNFIDFHSINDVFTRPMKFGKGIQDLKEIGQRIVHPASFVEAPLKFGAEIKPGSSFRNGEVSLELKGLSLVDGSPCALVTYDAGESNLKMIIPVSPDQDSFSAGGSQYKGDMYVDLATRWVRKATLDEYLVTETSIPDSPSKINQFTTRHILLRLIS
jgi:hypothetical protein